MGHEFGLAATQLEILDSYTVKTKPRIFEFYIMGACEKTYGIRCASAVFRSQVSGLVVRKLVS